MKQLNVIADQKLGKPHKFNLLSLGTFWMKLPVGLKLELLQIIVTCYDEMLTFHNFLQASAYAAVSERADALAGISSLTPKDRGGVIICPRLG